MRLSVAVMAHPTRAEAAEQLAAETGARVVYDDGGGEWATGVRAWQEHDPGADYHLVLQDDAVPCVDLREAVTAALPRLGGDVLSCYVGWCEQGNHGLVRRAVGAAMSSGAAWIRATSLWWGVAVAMPVPAIADMLAGCAGRREPYDTRIGHWCQRTGRDVRYTWPALVDHADGPSLVRPGRPSGRRAWRFVGRGPLALQVWDPGGPVFTVSTAKRPSSMVPLGAVTSPLAVAEPKDRRMSLHDPHRQRNLQSYLARRRERNGRETYTDVRTRKAAPPPRGGYTLTPQQPTDPQPVTDPGAEAALSPYQLSDDEAAAIESALTRADEPAQEPADGPGGDGEPESPDDAPQERSDGQEAGDDPDSETAEHLGGETAAAAAVRYPRPSDRVGAWRNWLIGAGVGAADLEGLTKSELMALAQRRRESVDGG